MEVDEEQQIPKEVQAEQAVEGCPNRQVVGEDSQPDRVLSQCASRLTTNRGR